MRLSRDDLFQIISDDLDVLEKELLQALASPVGMIDEIGRHLARSGGKRMRPAICLLAAHAGSSFDMARVMPLAVAVEMIHMASLVHDDVIDSANTRRGAPTANARWGKRAAILTGDYIFARALAVVSDRSYGEAIGKRLASIISELTEGEIMQDTALYTARHDTAEYLLRIEKKTAHFLAVCCEIGAMVSGAAENVSRALFAYGKNIGMAFQITDDLLDITGNPEKLGKPAGNDIRQGVVTLPVIRALAHSPKRAELSAIVSNERMTDDDVSRALSIVRESDGVDFSQNMAKDYLEAARSILPDDIPPDIHDTFMRATYYIEGRDY